MAIITGLMPSYQHSQNGMIKEDMAAVSRVADIHQEVIIFRSTGPWSKRWIERSYPTKNFHVKGKSSNWGPQAGLVPYNGVYSKVGHNPKQAQKGTHKNDQGIASGFAAKASLVISPKLLEEQLNRPEGKAKRTALKKIFPIANSNDKILIATRPGDGKDFAFRAFKQNSGNFLIHTYPAKAGTNPFKLIDADTQGPLEVMTSGEVGANKPMTGDYDLLAICPSWASYGNKLLTDVVKPGIQLRNKETAEPSATYKAGIGLDNVRDPSLHTQSDFPTMRTNAYHARRTRELGQHQGPVGQDSLSKLKAQGKLAVKEEHPDMGNLTPRILRCINNMNAQMGATLKKASLRRVHHNAESHRNAMFGAITGDEMANKFDPDGYGDGFPFTVFQPSALQQHAATQKYGAVCTLETYAEFKQYALDLKTAGYYVPKNWVWGF